MSEHAEPFSLTNIPVPTHTIAGSPITKGFKYRVLGFNPDTSLAHVAQRYAHRKSEVIQYEAQLQGKYVFVVRQVWDDGTKNYTQMEK